MQADFVHKAASPNILCKYKSSQTKTRDCTAGSFLVSRVIAALPQDGEGIRAAA